jgi:hypothetical protein
MKEQHVFVHLYPNPVQEELCIEASSPIEGIEIQQLNGSIIYSHISNETSAHISLAGLSPGMYLVNVKTTVANESCSFIKN